MSEDISGALGDLISKSKTFGNSDNIRVGRYKFLIKKVFAEKVDSGRFAFAELKVLDSAPNPQQLPPGVPANRFDDGTHPNLVNSDCAMKVNFDGPGAKSAPGNVKGFILGLFGLNQSETSEDDINSTWKDLTRQKALNVGDNLGIDPTTNQVIKADKYKPANPGAGMVIACTASMKEKKKTKALPPEQKEYITVLNWECVARPGTGENSKDMVAQRKAAIEIAGADDDDADDDVPSTPAPGSTFVPQTVGAPAAPVAVPVAPPPPVVAPAPPAPPVVFVPPSPWKAHPSSPVDANGVRWFWSDPAAGGTNEVLSESQLRPN